MTSQTSEPCRRRSPTSSFTTSPPSWGRGWVHQACTRDWWNPTDTLSAHAGVQHPQVFVSSAERRQQTCNHVCQPGGFHLLQVRTSLCEACMTRRSLLRCHFVVVRGISMRSELLLITDITHIRKQTTGISSWRKLDPGSKWSVSILSVVDFFKSFQVCTYILCLPFFQCTWSNWAPWRMRAQRT